MTIKQTHRGFTLLESLVVVSIFTIVMTAIVGSVIMFYRANAASLEQSYQINSARRGIEFLVREAREAAYADTGAYPVAGIASTSIAFYSDVDTDAPVELIRYTLLGTTLFRTSLDPSGVPPSYAGAGATSTVSEFVRNSEASTPVFRYYDAEGMEITDYTQVDEVRSVVVSLVVNILPLRAPEEFTLRAGATLRNLRN